MPISRPQPGEAPSTVEHVAAKPAPRLPDVMSADDAQHPWTILVEDGRIVGRYRAEDTHQAGADATRITLGGAQIDVYEVDARECLPPQVGEQVDPIRLGWVKVG